MNKNKTDINGIMPMFQGGSSDASYAPDAGYTAYAGYAPMPFPFQNAGDRPETRKLAAKSENEG